MGVMDRDGDLEGTTPADNLGECAALVARLRQRVAPDEQTKDDMRLAADVIEKLSAELTQARKWLVETEAASDGYKARLARAEDFIEQAPHVATCGAVWKARAEWPDCTCWKAEYKRAASDE